MAGAGRIGVLREESRLQKDGRDVLRCRGAMVISWSNGRRLGCGMVARRIEFECTTGTYVRSNAWIADPAGGASDAYPFFVPVYDAVANGVNEES